MKTVKSSLCGSDSNQTQGRLVMVGVMKDNWWQSRRQQPHNHQVRPVWALGHRCFILKNVDWPLSVRDKSDLQRDFNVTLNQTDRLCPATSRDSAAVDPPVWARGWTGSSGENLITVEAGTSYYSSDVTGSGPVAPAPLSNLVSLRFWLCNEATTSPLGSGLRWN